MAKLTHNTRVRVALLAYCFALLASESLRAISPSDRNGFVVVKSSDADFELPSYDSSTMGPLSDWKPPHGRVTPTYSNKDLSDATGSYKILLDNGKGRSSAGYVRKKDVAFFKDQGQAEIYASTLERPRSELANYLRSRPSQAGGHGSSVSGSTGETANAQAGTMKSPLKEISSVEEAQKYLGQIQAKLKDELGPQFVNKAKKGWRPSAQERAQYIEAIEQKLTPQERAFFTMTSTAFAEDRGSSRDKKDVNDPEARASMAFTMNIIESRADSKYARQFMDDKFQEAPELEKIFGVVTADRQFSSWNAGSQNFGNTIRSMLGVSDEEAVSRERALAAYRDYSTGKVHFLGFEEGADGATMMLNKEEVARIYGYMDKDEKYRRRYPHSIVSWTVESIMHNRRYKPGVHQVALRVPVYAISVPESEGSKEFVKVDPSKIGHWPVYLNNVHTEKMESARLSQEKRVADE